MTHHNLDEEEEGEGATTAAIETPIATMDNNAQLKKGKRKGGGSKKGSGGKKGRGQRSPGVPRTLKDKLVCSSCANPMSMSAKINYEEIPGKKIPKSADGKTPAFKSLGSSGKVVGVLCDDCLRNLEAGSPITLKTAAVEKPDGTVTNVLVNRLPG